MHYKNTLMYGIEKTNKFNRVPTSYAVWYYNVLLVTPGTMIIAIKIYIKILYIWDGLDEDEAIKMLLKYALLHRYLEHGSNIKLGRTSTLNS